jgi:5-methylcytosine-specific restriction endonuclease McrA
VRSFRHDPEAVEYARLVRRDPCSYCGGPGGSVDHVVPSVHGGPNVWDNFTGVCSSCNQSKRSRSLLEFLAGRGLSSGHKAAHDK